MAKYNSEDIFNLKDYKLSFANELQEMMDRATPSSLYTDRLIMKDADGNTIDPQNLIHRTDIFVTGPYVEYICDTTTTHIKTTFKRMFIVLQGGSVADITLTPEETETIQKLLDDTKSNDIPTDHCNGPYAITIRYSWGDVEEAINCKSFKKAWKKMKKLAMFEAETVSQEYECSVPLIIEYDKILHKGIITLNYTYDNTTCIYEIVRTGK